MERNRTNVTCVRKHLRRQEICKNTWESTREINRSSVHCVTNVSANPIICRNISAVYTAVQGSVGWKLMKFCRKTRNPWATFSKKFCRHTVNAGFCDWTLQCLMTIFFTSGEHRRGRSSAPPLFYHHDACCPVSAAINSWWPCCALHRGRGTAYHLPSELFHPSPPFDNSWSEDTFV